MATSAGASIENRFKPTDKDCAQVTGHYYIPISRIPRESRV